MGFASYFEDITERLQADLAEICRAPATSSADFAWQRTLLGKRIEECQDVLKVMVRYLDIATAPALDLGREVAELRDRAARAERQSRDLDQRLARERETTRGAQARLERELRDERARRMRAEQRLREMAHQEDETLRSDRSAFARLVEEYSTAEQVDRHRRD